MKKADLDAYRKLCGSPSRVVWAVASAGGRQSICPLAWQMISSFAPPIMAIAVASTRFTHELISASGEFVLAWPGEDLAAETLYLGTHSGRDEDKIASRRLTLAAGEFVQAPLIAECIVNMECRVVGQLVTGSHTIFAGEVLAVWANEHPKKALCLIGNEEGYQPVLENERYRFGVIKG